MFHNAEKHIAAMEEHMRRPLRRRNVSRYSRTFFDGLGFLHMDNNGTTPLLVQEPNSSTYLVGDWEEGSEGLGEYEFFRHFQRSRAVIACE